MQTLSTSPFTGSPDYRAFFNQLKGLCAYPLPQESVPLMHETVFQQLLLDVVSTENPVGFRRFRRLLYEAMVHFRRMKEGDLTGGFAELQRLRANFPPLSAEVGRLGEAMLTPMIAYYYFRTGDYPAAIDHNQQAISISSELQSVYPILHLHQIQQQFNISRVELARQQYPEALHTLKELIDYLIVGHLPTLTGSWPDGLRLGVAPPLLNHQLFDMLNELVFTALRLPALETTITDTVLADVGQWLSQRTVPIPSAQSAILTWWQSHQHESDEGQQLFLSDISTLIEQYPSAYDQLKLLLLGRLYFLAAHSDSGTPEYLLLIRRFVNTKLQLSPRLLQHIRRVRQQG